MLTPICYLSIDPSDVPTRRWVLERFVAWAVRANLVCPLSLSAVEKNSLRSTKELKPENADITSECKRLPR